MWNIIISFSITNIIIFGLILLFQHIDKEIKIHLTKKDIIIILIVTALTSIVNINKYNIFLVGYLIFMSYTDQKTKLLYTSVSLAMIIYEIIMIVINIHEIPFNEYTWTIGLLIAALFIISLFHGIGMGDILIYIVISLYYIRIYTVPTLYLMITIILANIVFIIISVYKRFKHGKEASYPLTSCIAFGTILCTLLL